MDTCHNIEKFKTDLLNCINNCGLSIGTAYYVTLNVVNEFTKTYAVALATEQNELEEENISIGGSNGN